MSKYHSAFRDGYAVYLCSYDDKQEVRKETFSTYCHHRRNGAENTVYPQLVIRISPVSYAKRNPLVFPI